MEAPTYADVVAARDVVHRYIRPTPLYEWPALSQMLGCRFYLKHENHSPTTAFKVRGGIYLVARLSDEQKRRGIIGCTTGNHGQSLAYACRQFGVRCVLVVPTKNNPDKVAAMRALGAELIAHGQDFDDARLHCEKVCQQEGLRYVHSANEPNLIAGVGTLALELFDELPDPDVVLAPIGLGSGICGTAIVAAERNPKTRVIGVQAEKAPAVTLSWRSDQPVETGPPETFAEGMATRMSASLTLSIMKRLVPEIVLVSETELREAVRLLLRVTHNLAEGGGGCFNRGRVSAKGSAGWEESCWRSVGGAIWIYGSWQPCWKTNEPDPGLIRFSPAQEKAVNQEFLSSLSPPIVKSRGFIHTDRNAFIGDNCD